MTDYSMALKTAALIVPLCGVAATIFVCNYKYKSQVTKAREKLLTDLESKGKPLDRATVTYIKEILPNSLFFH